MEPKRTRKLLRLKEYDYTQNNCYFVTICAIGKECLFGQVVDDTVQLNELGLMVEQEWLHLPERFEGIEVVPFIVMPNHVHAIVAMDGAHTKGRTSLSMVIQAYKSITTNIANRVFFDCKGKLWQRSFYDHIIRNWSDYDRIAQYIAQNPARWNGEP